MAVTFVGLTLMLMVIVSDVSCQAFPGEPCAVVVYGRPTEGSQYEKEVDPSCMNGTITWHYPQGELYVTFMPALPSSSVCLWHGIGPPAEAVYKMMYSGPIRIPDPTKSDVICVDLVEGKMVIKFDDPSFQTYMNAYEYSIVAQ